MSKSLFIAEKPSVAREFARALGEKCANHDGYLESDSAVITWCVGHLVTMSYPEAYGEQYKKWQLETLPFLPAEFKYEIISGVKKQFETVSKQLSRDDVNCIYVCTDSGREGEYIYRLVAQMAGIKGKEQRRVWIDSQTEEEIKRGIREAKDLSEYDDLASSAYLRAKEDYLMGINFSRALSVRYAGPVSNYLGNGYHAISVGRVMTCVLGMVVRREIEIREFVKTSFYRVLMHNDAGGADLMSEWKVTPGSMFEGSPALYKENGFKKKADAEKLIYSLKNEKTARVEALEKKKEIKNPPLLYNLAELQNDCSKRFKISPDQTLGIVQELYEKKMVTYPRTDARVLSTAVAKEIGKNIKGLCAVPGFDSFASEILGAGKYKGIGKSRYTNDKQITDHYAIIPTGQGLGALNGLSAQSRSVYDLIAVRFLSIFMDPAKYMKISLTLKAGAESFFANTKALIEPGYLKLAGDNEKTADAEQFSVIGSLKKGDELPVKNFEIKEGETSPPKRYTSGSMILAMENAGQLIEDEDLRAQIKGSGIGTSATRAEILKKLFNIKYLSLNKKTQVITPTQLGEMVYTVVYASIRSLLNPELTASWEKGLTYVAEGSVTSDEYMEKLNEFITVRIDRIKALNNARELQSVFDRISQYYKKRPRARQTKST